MMYKILFFILLYNSCLDCFKLKMDLKSDLKRTSLLSKLIYDYNYLENNNKPDFVIEQTSILNKNITFDFINQNNIYFDLIQYVTCLETKNFIKNYNENRMEIFNSFFPDINLYGYFFNKKRLHSLILIDNKEKEIIVVFRGSQYLDEWFENLKICEKKITFEPEYKIHKGIFDMYSRNNVDDNIIYILKNLFDIYPNHRKIFTGHSKGAINSILLSLELTKKIDNKYKYEIFGFGSPQILNYKLSNYTLNKNNIYVNNVINELDIITRLPFKKYHIGKKILLNKNTIKISKKKKIFKLKNNVNIKNFYDSIFNHNLIIYIKNIFRNDDL